MLFPHEASGSCRSVVRSSVPLVVCASIMLAAFGAAAADPTDTSVATAEQESPWLIIPTLSSSPKLGTSLGAMVSYLHHFDEKSKVSMVAVNAQYTSTDPDEGVGSEHEQHRVPGMDRG